MDFKQLFVKRMNVILFRLNSSEKENPFFFSHQKKINVEGNVVFFPGKNKCGLSVYTHKETCCLFVLFAQKEKPKLTRTNLKILFILFGLPQFVCQKVFRKDCISKKEIVVVTSVSKKEKIIRWRVFTNLLRNFIFFRLQVRLCQKD